MGNALPLVTLPASASASASAKKEPLSKLEPVPLTRADWDHLLEERVSIMVESSVSEGRAKALATHDTVLRHGHRPGVDL